MKRALYIRAIHDDEKSTYVCDETHCVMKQGLNLSSMSESSLKCELYI